MNGQQREKKNSIVNYTQNANKDFLKKKETVISYGGNVTQLSKQYKTRDEERNKTFLSINNYIKDGTKKELDDLKKAYENLNNKMKQLTEEKQFKDYQEKLKKNEADKQLEEKIHKFYKNEYDKIVNDKSINENKKEELIDDLDQFMEDEFGICFSRKKVIMLLNPSPFGFF